MNTRVGNADMHVTVLAGKSVQSFGKGNMSLEGRRKAERWQNVEAEVTSCVVRSVQKCGFV